MDSEMSFQGHRLHQLVSIICIVLFKVVKILHIDIYVQIMREQTHRHCSFMSIEIEGKQPNFWFGSQGLGHLNILNREPIFRFWNQY